MAATARPPVNVGDILEDKYRVDAFLGRGAMGYVVRVTHLKLERTFAIKILLSASKGEAERRFMREARIASKLKSIHVGRVDDVGVHNGSPFIVMEYLEGEDLSSLVDRIGPLSVDLAVLYVLQACEALAEAHAAGIVHRDVKPANIMLTKGPLGAPLIKVLDFGVSKAVEAIGVGGTEENRLTATAQALGSPLYMAPEQINDAANVDQRADIWSIGVVLYQLLTGATPWVGNTLLALFSSMASHPPTPLAEYRPDVPAGLAAAVEQCFERDRARRWPNLAEFAAALAPYCSEPGDIWVRRIASRHRLPPVNAERPTEPMPAPGEASAFGWMGAAKSPAAANDVPRHPLVSRPEDSGPVAMPARTSVVSTGGIAWDAWRTRLLPIGLVIGSGALAAIIAWKVTTPEPQQAAGPVVTQELPAPSRPPQPPPSVDVAAPVVTLATTSTAILSPHPLTPVASSPPPARPKATPRPVPTQPPLAPTRADPPEGPRR